MTSRIVTSPAEATSVHQKIWRVGCVSYLNSKPLIEGVDSPGFAEVVFGVPSVLLDELLADRTQIALCPVIDFYRSPQKLEIVPVGGIACHGPTLTVRLFSKIPIQEVREIHADTDSHTSVALVRILMARRYGLTPRLVHFDARKFDFTVTGSAAQWPQTVLLIGDKVVANEPPRTMYPHQVDLGEAWREQTGLPLVFAVWMCKQGADLGTLGTHLKACREINAGRIDQIVKKYAKIHGWPEELALKYLGELLRYPIATPELEAIERFGELARQIGIISEVRPLILHAV
jgi:chorismate dehydratase